MTKRATILAIAGAALIALGYFVRDAVLRATRVDYPGSDRGSVGADGGYKLTGGPQVVLGYDGPEGRVGSAVRVDVLNGVPHTRGKDRRPIEDVTAYVNEELSKTGATWVVVTASRDESYGGVVSVIDACKRTRAHAIVLNENVDGDAVR